MMNSSTVTIKKRNDVLYMSMNWPIVGVVDSDAAIRRQPDWMVWLSQLGGHDQPPGHARRVETAQGLRFRYVSVTWRLCRFSTTFLTGDGPRWKPLTRRRSNMNTKCSY